MTLSARTVPIPARGHAAAWSVWWIAALVVASSSAHPLVTLGVLGAAIAAVAIRVPPGERGPFRVLLTLGAVFVLLRVALFTLTGRAGETVLLELPELQLPALLGGIRLGGALSAEVAANELAEGLRLFAILAATGAFVAVIEVADLIRLLPSRLRRVGLVLQIALAFLPALVASVREVREAQRIRGVRVRGLRSAVPIIVPVLAGALDRSFALAEALHARGIEREGATRMRARTPTRSELVVAVSAGIALVAGSLAARTPAGSWRAYPALAWPDASPLLLVAPLLLLVPLLLEERS